LAIYCIYTEYNIHTWKNGTKSPKTHYISITHSCSNTHLTHGCFSITDSVQPYQNVYLQILKNLMFDLRTIPLSQKTAEDI
jgi:hypothetical protein